MAARKKVPAKSAKARKPAANRAKSAAKAAKPARKPAAKARTRPAAKAKPRKAAPKSRAKTAAVPRKSAKPATAKGAAKAPSKPVAAKVAKAPKAPKVPKAPKAPKASTVAPAKAVVAEPAAKAKPVAPPPQPEPRGPRAVAVAAKSRRIPLPADDDESGEPEDRHNLLLGPRNVTPYIERKGEQYMGREQLDHFRTILQTWKRDLMEEVDRTMTHMKDEAANPPDPNDRATLESEFALELRTRDRERKLIRKIEEALKRIDDGSYGYCLETGEPIGVKRLEARPVATLCIEAQERRERREKQYGDRDDWYR